MVGVTINPQCPGIGFGYFLQMLGEKIVKHNPSISPGLVFSSPVDSIVGMLWMSSSALDAKPGQRTVSQRGSLCPRWVDL